MKEMITWHYRKILKTEFEVDNSTKAPTSLKKDTNSIEPKYAINFAALDQLTNYVEL